MFQPSAHQGSSGLSENQDQRCRFFESVACCIHRVSGFVLSALFCGTLLAVIGITILIQIIGVFNGSAQLSTKGSAAPHPST